MDDSDGPTAGDAGSGAVSFSAFAVVAVADDFVPVGFFVKYRPMKNFTNSRK